MLDKLKDSLIAKLVIGILVGVTIGFTANQSVIGIVMTFKHIFGQFIFFFVPLIIIGFITPSIIQLSGDASKILMTTLGFAYLSSVGAGLMSTFAGYFIIPGMQIDTNPEGLKVLPELMFQLDIPPMLAVMSALVFAIVFGLAIMWTKSETWKNMFDEFHNIMMLIVTKMIIPILPFFIATTFAELAYEGGLTTQLPIFFKVIVIVLIGHFIWLMLLYGIAGLMAKENGFEVLKNYGPAYLTALGTMSSAATLPVSLASARKSEILDDEIVDFVIPIGSNVHMPGSVLTEVFFVMAVSQVLYGQLPSAGNMILFVFLLGVFAIGAPGVPGGTVMASLGIITGILGFDDAGVALMLTIFALQDSFGTACNITGDGAIALMVTSLFGKKKGRKAKEA